MSPPASILETAAVSESSILIFAPSGRDGELTANFLEQFDHHVEQFRDMAALCNRTEEGCDLILLAEETLNSNSVKLLLETLGRQPPWSDIPIFIITSGGEANPERLRILSSIGPRGNVGLLERPFRRGTLLSTVEVALRSRQRQYQVRNLLMEVKGAQTQLEKQVQERTVELTETNAQLETLVYSIAHDLRAPLRSMQAFAQILLDDYAPQLDETAVDYAKRIVRASETMDALVLDLLAYGKAARSDIKLEATDLEATWQTALRQFEEEIAEKKAVIITKHPLPAVMAQAANLSQILANLLGNALKFVAPGVVPTIHLSAVQTGDIVRISMEDNGIGILPEYHDKIFHVFERLENGQSEGTGIGLAIVRKGVERMGGKAGVISGTPQTGSIFWVELPKACDNV